MLYNSVASKAVDGDTNGDHKAGSCTHSDWEVRPWWAVDLGIATSVFEVEISNRVDDKQGTTHVRICGALFVPELLAFVLVLRKSALIKNCIKKHVCRRRLTLCIQTRMSITIDDVMYVYTGQC